MPPCPPLATLLIDTPLAENPGYAPDTTIKIKYCHPSFIYLNFFIKYHLFQLRHLKDLLLGILVSGDRGL